MMRDTARTMALACALGMAASPGCTGPDDSDDDSDVVPPVGEGLVGDHPLNPFPVGALHMVDGAVALDPEDFELETQTPLKVERVAWREGFSVAQTSVLALPDLDPSGFPDWRMPTPGEGSVRLVDLTDGEWLPTYAELDAHPDAEPTLLVRPLLAVEPGHRVGVVVTTAAAAPVERFHALLDGPPPPDLEDHAEHFRELVDQLGDLGVSEDDIAIAWDYPVGDGTAPMRSMWEQVELPTTWSFDDIDELDAGDTVAPFTFRAAQGTYTTTDFLVDDLGLQLGADGSVSPTGTVGAHLYVHVPESVADAPAGSVPVLLFGHGIFSEPEAYLGESDDPSRVDRLAEEAGVIVVGTRWRGLTTPDLTGAVAAAGDFARIHEVTDRLVQAQANTKGLIRLMDEGDLFDDPVFEGRQGQNLVDRDALRYYGISLGGIEGAVMLVDEPPLDAAVLHVPGGIWSTMLERSSNWTLFELALQQTVPDPLQRQRLYATSQLWWDAADPISYTSELANVQTPYLLQEAIGDEQVPNMTTRALARSIGLSQIGPVVEPVWGLDTVMAPLPPGSSGYVQLDPERPLPPDTNTPAPVTNAHTTPRKWVETQTMTLGFLEPGAEGTVVSPCGSTACTDSNTTDPQGAP